MFISVWLYIYVCEKEPPQHILILSAGKSDQRIMANTICHECKLMPTHHTCKVCGAIVYTYVTICELNTSKHSRKSIVACLTNLVNYKLFS